MIDENIIDGEIYKKIIPKKIKGRCLENKKQPGVIYRVKK